MHRLASAVFTVSFALALATGACTSDDTTTTNTSPDGGSTSSSTSSGGSSSSGSNGDASTTDSGGNEAGSDGAAGGTSVNGTVNAQTLVGIGAAVKYVHKGDKVQGNVVIAEIASADICPLLGGAVPAAGQALSGEISSVPDTAELAVGTYTIMSGQKMSFLVFDGASATPTSKEDATSGTFVVTASTATKLTGTLDMTFPGGPVAGSFEAVVCP